MNDDHHPPQTYGPNGTDEHGAIFNIPPPPENTYPSEAELERAIHAWSKEHGYELVRRASKRNAKGVLYKRYYHCSKHGKRANTGKLTDETRQRVNRKSGRVDCPMSLAAVAVDATDPEGAWQIRHRKSHHNHGPIKAVELAGHRRRARMGPVEQAIDGLFAIGTSTAHVLQFLQKTNPEGLFTRTDVANMKNRYKKWGTCADRIQRGENHVSTVRYKSQNGMPIPCVQCRQKQVTCGSERPRCRNCEGVGGACEYSHHDQQTTNLEDTGFEGGAEAQIDLTATTAPPQPSNSTRSNRAPAARSNTTTAEQTEQILASLKTFQAEHITPQRLTLSSSSVEVLAHSSCGNGDTYRSLPFLNTEQDWPAFRDAMVEAAMKENTFEVLVGLNAEPLKPCAGPEGMDIELWNEYIKQLAIHNRRNSLLISAMLAKVGPMFKNRLYMVQNAAQAWSALEDMCAPRGSATAYGLFCEVHSITLANSTSLQNYISRLDGVYTQFKQLKLNTGTQPHTNARTAKRNENQHLPALPQTGSEAMPEESLIFLFLRGLGPEWKGWVEGMCMTSNIGGFGTGERLGWKEVWKAAVRAEGLARRGG